MKIITGDLHRVLAHQSGRGVPGKAAAPIGYTHGAAWCRTGARGTSPSALRLQPDSRAQFTVFACWKMADTDCSLSDAAQLRYNVTEYDRASTEVILAIKVIILHARFATNMDGRKSWMVPALQLRIVIFNDPDRYVWSNIYGFKLMFWSVDTIISKTVI